MAGQSNLHYDTTGLDEKKWWRCLKSTIKANNRLEINMMLTRFNNDPRCGDRKMAAMVSAAPSINQGKE